MPLFLKEENQELKNKSFKLPKKLQNKLKEKLSALSQYSQTKGYKRLKSMVYPKYNDHSNNKNNTNDGKHISYNDMKRIHHDFKYMDKNPKNLIRQLNGGEELANFVNNTLQHERNKVEPVLKQKKVETRNKNKVKPTINPMKPIKVGNIEANVHESLIKENYNIEDHPYYDCLLDYDARYVLESFIRNENLWTPLINPNMYKKALDEFTKYGYFINFPTKYIYQWIGIIMKNTATLKACTELCGHSQWFPTDAVVDVFFDEDYEAWEEFKNEHEENSDYYAADIIFNEKGFYDWNVLPDNSYAISDYGIQPLEELIAKYNSDLKPEEVIVLINKILDITHQRGDLSSMFITGGRKTLSQISEDIKKNKKKIYINEKQLYILENLFN